MKTMCAQCKERAVAKSFFGPKTLCEKCSDMPLIAQGIPAWEEKWAKFDAMHKQEDLESYTHIQNGRRAIDPRFVFQIFIGVLLLPLTIWTLSVAASEWLCVLSLGFLCG